MKRFAKAEIKRAQKMDAKIDANVKKIRKQEAEATPKES